jgi:hypothetical protein
MKSQTVPYKPSLIADVLGTRNNYKPNSNRMKKMIMPILAGLLVTGTLYANLPTGIATGTAIERPDSELRLSLFPNPNNTGFVKVVVENIKNAGNKAQIVILRPDGRPAFSEMVEIKEDATQLVHGIDISGFDPGIYTVRVVVGEKILRQRLVVR